jgi:hypothetical protein
VGPLGFLPVDPMEVSSPPSTPGLTTRPTRPEQGPGSGENPSEPGSGTDASATKTPTSGRSRTSFDSSAIRDLTRTAVGGAAFLAHDKLVKSDEARAAELWLTTDEQDAAIGDPIANIAARRINLGKLADSKDAEDIIQLVAATAGYLTQQLRKLTSILRDRRARKARAMAAPTHEDQEVEQS